MRSKYLILGILLVLISPFVLSFAQTLSDTGHYVKRSSGGSWEWDPGLSIWGTAIGLFGTIFLWSGVPLIVLGLITQPKGRSLSLLKMKHETTISTVILLCGCVASVWSSQLKSQSIFIFDFEVPIWLVTMFGIGITIAGSLSLVGILIRGWRQQFGIAAKKLKDCHGSKLINISLEKISSDLTNRASKSGFGPPSCSGASLILTLLIVLTIVTIPIFVWLRWIAMFLFCWAFIRKGSSVGYQVLLEQVGKNATPVVAALGLLYSFAFPDPLSSAISNSTGVFFLFFSFDVPRLIVHANEFFERTLFSLICAFLAFGGNFFMGSVLGVLETLRDGGSYDALGTKLDSTIFPIILLVVGIIVAELFCEARFLRARGFDNYAYEKASGSLFYLSFFFGFGGNKIISPLLFSVSFGMLLIGWRVIKNPAQEAWSNVRKLRLSLVEKFVDTSIDQQLVTEGVLGSAVLAMLNFRFIGYIQIELVQVLTILAQSVPFLLFLCIGKRFFTNYVASRLLIILTSLVGLFYFSSWSFCGLMASVATNLSNLFGSTGIGEVPAITFLSWIPFFCLFIVLGEVTGIPIDLVRRGMERSYKNNRQDQLKKSYRLSMVIMFFGSALFLLCSYLILMRYHPSFVMLQNGEPIYYDLFWPFLLLYTGGFAAKELFSRYELYKPINLLQANSQLKPSRADIYGQN